MAIGTAGLVFGVTDEGYGYLEDLTINEDVQQTRVNDGAGNIKGVNYFGKLRSITFTYVHFSATSAPYLQVGTGTPITLTDSIADGNWYVVSSGKAKKSGDSYKVSITAEQYPALGT